mgnify:CR=1 FL=1
MSAPLTAAFIALGANLGDPLTTLRWAVTELRSLGQVKALSRLYRTVPVGGPAGQPEYLNAATCLHTPLSAPDLLAGLHDIEARAGRTRTERWEARTLDLDLILYGQLTSDAPELLLPHPRAWDRAFVLAPLSDLHPHLTHPTTGETVSAALARTDRRGVEAHFDDWYNNWH